MKKAILLLLVLSMALALAACDVKLDITVDGVKKFSFQPSMPDLPGTAAAEATETPGETVIVETVPSPSPTPIPIPEEIKVFFYEDEKEEFTEKVGESVRLRAVAYPEELFPEARFRWSVSDESVIKLTVSADTQECEVLCLKHQPGGVILTVECNGVTTQLMVYTKS